MHLSIDCWSALCLATAVQTDPDTQEVEHLAFPHPRMCLGKAPSPKHMDRCEVDARTQTQHLSPVETLDMQDRRTLTSTRLHMFPWLNGFFNFTHICSSTPQDL